VIGKEHFLDLFAELGINCLVNLTPECMNVVSDTLLDTILATHPNHAQDPLKKAWFEGRILNKELLPIAHDLCDKYPHFRSDRHKKVTKLAFEIMFVPEKLRSTRMILGDMLDMLKEAAEQKDEFGKPLHKFYILSNWEPESWKVLYEAPELQEVFKYFPPENIFVSAHMVDSKPNHSIFHTLLEQANIKPEDAILIDDLTENIEAARAVGMHGVWRDKHGDDEDVRKQLEDLGVF
jgi:FMN phosphatase YigB (HAD superfamily)